MKLIACNFVLAVAVTFVSPNVCNSRDVGSVTGSLAIQSMAAPDDLSNLHPAMIGQPEDTFQTEDSIQTGSVSAGGAAGPEQIPFCVRVPAPPATLQTKSKYRADDKSKSLIDENAMAARDESVQPIRNSIRMLTEIAYADSSSWLVSQARAECVLQNIDRWASAKALTEMRTADAYLSRDRWVAEIALAVQSASGRVELSSQRMALYSKWFGGLARDTIEAYTFRLGPTSKTNNHRYWAGLSVAAIGYLLDDPGFKAWGKGSFEIGACQVDHRGFLPAELARGKKALDYHVYALRPLAAIVKLVTADGEAFQSKCFDRFRRLSAMTRDALRDPTEFERVAGMRQAATSGESSYSAALKLDALPLF